MHCGVDGQRVQKLWTFYALPNDWSSIPSTCIRLTAICNWITKNSVSSSGPWVTRHSHIAQKYMETKYIPKQNIHRHKIRWIYINFFKKLKIYALWRNNENWVEIIALDKNWYLCIILTYIYLIGHRHSHTFTWMSCS